jgi:hypothetical protein
MDLHARVDELCKALDARHTGCQIEVVRDDIQVVRTFSYASKHDLQITDVLRALASPDWQRAIAEVQAAVQVRVARYKEELRLENARAPLGTAPNLEGSTQESQSVTRRRWGRDPGTNLNDGA